MDDVLVVRTAFYAPNLISFAVSFSFFFEAHFLTLVERRFCPQFVHNTGKKTTHRIGRFYGQNDRAKTNRTGKIQAKLGKNGQNRITSVRIGQNSK